jgi:outer membrane lipoprotein-sorting protein
MTTPPSARVITCAAALAACFLAVSTGTARAADLGEVLAAFDLAQDKVRTLSADFVQVTTNPMFVEPVRAEGRFFMTKPDSIRWEYRTPEEMSFVIANDRYTGYFPARKKAEKKNVQRYSKKIFRYFGLGQSSADLLKAYDITLTEPEEGSDGTHLLVLEPKKRRARKRVERVRFWLDAKSYLPVKVEYRGKDGGTRVVEFTEVRVNPDLAANLFTVQIPSDVTVTSGFSGLPNFGSSSTH